MNDPNPAPLEGIAIVGMAGKFPGANDLAAFWDNLVQERETITTFTKADLPGEEASADPDYVARRGVLEKPEWFDATFFGMKPREAEATDPQQRLFLEVCWQALEDAAIDPSRAPGPIGVYAGMSNNSYFQSQVQFNAELREQVGAEQIMIGNEKDYLATRVAYKLNLRGPALNIYTACSTSLVAVCQAVVGLQSYQCDAAIAGGVSVKFPQERGYIYEEGGIFSPDGSCRAFDEKAQGTVFGNGAAAVILKRVEDAVRDGDRIYAVIKGAAINNDGAEKVSFTAPSVSGHAEVISLAQALGGIDPESITYVEAHGTGTPIGDPIEIAGLTEAFRSGGDRRFQKCAIGSCKTNIGHLDAAAGVAGLIKTALSLHHRTLPASLHFQQPNPTLGLDKSPFYVNDRTKPWSSLGQPLRAGVSSFGIGGTNAHVVLEEAPSLPARPREKGGKTQLLVLSAKSETALEEMRQQLVQNLEQSSEVNLADVAATLQLGRQAFNHRLMLGAESVSGAAAQLRGAVGQDYFKQATSLTQVPVTFLFPGQGSQHIRMGAALYASELVYRECIDACAEGLKSDLDLDIRTLLFPEPEFETQAQNLLEETRYTQPALFITEYALARLLMSWDVTPGLMLGHSIGEYVAACLAGVMTLEEALRLVAARGRLLFECAPGVMLGVRSNESTLRPMLREGVDFAAMNSPNLVVLSGSEEDIEAMEVELKAGEIQSRRLLTSHAFHSRLMEPAMEKFRQVCAGIRFQAPTIPYVSNLTGRLITDREAVSIDYYVQHIRQPVRFAEGVDSVLMEGPCALLEVGPGMALTTMAKQHPNAAAATMIVNCLPSSKEHGSGEEASLMQALGRLWLGGVAIEWSRLHEGTRRKRVGLPGYAFQRQPFVAARSIPEGSVRVGESALMLAPGPVRIAAAGHGEAELVPEATGGTEISRREHLLEVLRGQLHKASGIDISSAPAAASFFDLGFDSLFLTQASLFLKKHFSLKITFRQLAEELNSLDALAAYLDAKLPAGTFGPKPTGVPTGLAPAAVPGSVAERLALIERTIAELRSGVVETQRRYRVKAVSQKVNADRKIPFGPFRPLQTAKDGTLTSVQRAHLENLVAAYVKKTRKSKEFTARHRHHFADPRAVAGFNHLWKEAVYPLVVDRSEGGRIWDVDGNEFIDITQGFGVGFLGHRPSFVVEAVQAQLERGMEIGPTSPLVGEVAELFLEFTGLDRVSFCDTGSEAVMAAIRMARTVSGRDKLVMFAGAYHGIMDEVLVRPMLEGDQLHTIPIAPGIPEAVGENILVLDYDNPESLEIIRTHASEIAGVLVETVQSRRPELQPAQFLHDLRRITQEGGIALILDEVVNGFRIHPRGAAGWFGIEADIATYGKIIGGGLPIGVVAGKRKYMDALDGGNWRYGDDSGPEVGVTFFAGTFVRHPLALAAARAVLLHLKAEGPSLQEKMNARTAKFVAMLNAHCEEVGVPIRLTHFSSYFYVNFAPQLKYTELLFLHLRLRGVHVWAGRSSFLCTQHTNEDMEGIFDAWRESIRDMQDGGFLPVKEDLEKRRAAPAAALEVVASLMPGFAPLTGAQQELLLMASMSEEASSACHESISIEIQGPLQVECMHASLGLLVERHTALRAGFAEGGEGMSIAAQVRLPMPLLDLAEVSPVEQQLRLEEMKRTHFLTPFSLSHPPLLRAALVVLSANEHVLLLTAHHLACDGWSFGVLCAELPLAYAAAQGGGGFPGEPAPRFDAYAAEQRMLRAAGEFAESKSYWLNQLSNPPGPLLLPVDFPRAEISYDTLTGRLDLPRALAQEVGQFCRDKKLTLFNLLLGTWQILLHRLSGQSDFLVGVPFAGQSAAGQPGLVGHCVQFLPLRSQLEPTMTVKYFLAMLRDQMMEALDHQNFTLGEILDEFSGMTAGVRQGFVPAVFSLEGMASRGTASGVSFHPVPNNKLRSNFQLSLYAYHGDDELQLFCVGRKSLFREETIQRWLDHYRELLESVIRMPGVQLARLPILTSSQRHEILHGFNSPGRNFGGDVCLHAWFEQMVQKQPQAPALTCNGITLTYEELNKRANQVAHALLRDGVRPGMLVAVLTDRDLTLVPALIGILKAGAGYLPMDPSYPDERLTFMLQDAGVRVLLTQQGLSERLPQPGCKKLFLDDAAEFINLSQNDPQTLVNPDDTAYVIYTSGSTGNPKGCIVTHRNVARLMQGTEAWFQFNSKDVWTLFHSAAFDFSVWEMWGALLYGGRLVVVPYVLSRSPDEFYRFLSAEGVTVLNQTPSAFRQLMAVEDLPGDKPALALRYVIFGGETLEMPSLQPWFANHGDDSPQLVNMFGITETTVHVTYRALGRNDVRGGSVIGVPIPDLQIYVLDEHREPVPMGVVGEMYVGGAGLARGYFNRSVLTAERFVVDTLSGRPGARLYRTGDMARILPGRDLEYLGRLDAQVKVRGFRIELGEIESVLNAHPDVRQAAVMAREDAEGEKYLVGYVVCGLERPTVDSLRNFLRHKLPDYMIPASIVFLEELPLTPNGKLDRRALPEPEREQAALRETPYVAPRNHVEERLALIWQEILRLPRVGAEDNFFEIGGTSLHGLRLFMRIREEFRVSLPLGTLFQSPTLARLAVHIETSVNGARGTGSPLACIQEGGTEVPFFGVHGGDGGALFYKGLLPGLGRERPFFTLESPALVDETIPIEIRPIAHVASEYLALVRAAQRRGPYVLGGYSYGGIVAYEMAQQLLAAGEEVSMVVLFDTENPNVPAREYSLGERIAVSWKNSQSDNVAGKLLQLGGRFSSGLLQRLRTENEIASARRLMKQGVKAEDERLRYVQIRECNLASLENYQAKPLRTTLVLLRSEEVSDKFALSEDYGWTSLVDKLVIERVPGNHLEIFDEPNVTIMADHLRNRLDELAAKSTVPKG